MRAPADEAPGVGGDAAPRASANPDPILRRAAGDLGFYNTRELHPDGQLEAFGQELNAESYAICRSDMMLKGQDARNIAFGNTLSNDQHDHQFDYMLSNPPFGVEWKKIEAAVKEERDTLGHASRFGAGLPRINDGSFLFLQHMISKMKPAEEGGSRIAIVFDGSPLFTGRRGRASRRSVAGSSRTTGLTLSSRWAGHVLFRGAGWRALAGLRPGQVECEGDGAELDDEPLVSRDGLGVVGTVERFFEFAFEALDPVTSSLRRSRTAATFPTWRDPDSNRGHHDFQSCALPTELSRRGAGGYRRSFTSRPRTRDRII